MNQSSSMSQPTREIERVFASDPDRCAEFVRELLGLLNEELWHKDDVFAIRMAMEEAVMNAIKHGNAKDPSKKVRVEIRLDANRFYATVSDEGSGFSLADVPDPTDESNLEKTSGRGVKLIQTFVDVCRYSDDGNSVELIKHRTPEN